MQEVVGSSPIVSTPCPSCCEGYISVVTDGGLAQSVRALASHARGRWFESSNLHLKTPLLINVFRSGVFLLLSFTHNLLYHILSPILRQYRTKIVSQMRCQIVQKFRRHTDVCRGISVQDDGKYASRLSDAPRSGAKGER